MNDNLIVRRLTKGVCSPCAENISEFSYIANPDGSMRWMYPSNLREPTFLSFYNTASFRARAFSALIKLSFLLGLHRFLRSGDILLNVDFDSVLAKATQRNACTGFSIFTGTAGEDRKVIIELNNEGVTKLFVKVGLSESSKRLVITEAKVVARLNEFKFTYLKCPEVLFMDMEGVVELSNIRPKAGRQYARLRGMHVNVLSELSGVSFQKRKWKEILITEKADSKLNRLTEGQVSNNGLKESQVRRLLKKLSTLKSLVCGDEHFPCGLAHGDFTPWNMYLEDEILYLFDWEHGREGTPLLFDLFHFVFQSEILIRRSSYKKLKSELFRVMELKEAKDLIEKYGIDVNTHYLFYLVSVCSYYLEKYTHQAKLHEQVHWLVGTWEDAVDDILFHNCLVFSK